MSEMPYKEAGLEVFGMEILQGTEITRAVSAAIESAVQTAQREFLAGVRDDLLVQAEALDADEESAFWDDGPGALILYAYEIDQRLPMEQRKDGSGTRH